MLSVWHACVLAGWAAIAQARTASETPRYTNSSTSFTSPTPSACCFVFQETVTARYWDINATITKTLLGANVTTQNTTFIVYDDATETIYNNYTRYNVSTTSLDYIPIGRNPLFLFTDGAIGPSQDVSHLTGTATQTGGVVVSSPAAFYVYTTVEVITAQPVTDASGNEVCGTMSSNADFGTIYSEINEHAQQSFFGGGLREAGVTITFQSPFIYQPERGKTGATAISTCLQSGSQEEYGYVPQAVMDELAHNTKYDAQYTGIASCLPGGPSIISFDDPGCQVVTMTSTTTRIADGSTFTQVSTLPFTTNVAAPPPPALTPTVIGGDLTEKNQVTITRNGRSNPTPGPGDSSVVDQPVPVGIPPGTNKTPPGENTNQNPPDQQNQQTPNGNQQTPNGNQQTPNGNQQTPNGNQQTPNGNQQTPNGDQQTPNGNQQNPPAGNQQNPPNGNQQTPGGGGGNQPGNQDNVGFIINSIMGGGSARASPVPANVAGNAGGANPTAGNSNNNAQPGQAPPAQIGIPTIVGGSSLLVIPQPTMIPVADAPKGLPGQTSVVNGVPYIIVPQAVTFAPQAASSFIVLPSTSIPLADAPANLQGSTKIVDGTSFLVVSGPATLEVPSNTQRFGVTTFIEGQPFLLIPGPTSIPIAGGGVDVSGAGTRFISGTPYLELTGTVTIPANSRGSYGSTSMVGGTPYLFFPKPTLIPAKGAPAGLSAETTLINGIPFLVIPAPTSVPLVAGSSVGETIQISGTDYLVIPGPTAIPLSDAPADLNGQTTMINGTPYLLIPSKTSIAVSQTNTAQMGQLTAIIDGTSELIIAGPTTMLDNTAFSIAGSRTVISGSTYVIVPSRTTVRGNADKTTSSSSSSTTSSSVPPKSTSSRAAAYKNYGLVHEVWLVTVVYAMLVG